MAVATVDPGAQVMNAIAVVLAWTAAGLLAYGALNWAVAHPRFALTELDVTTPVAHVTEAQLRLVSERRVRGTFFTVDLDQVRASLEKLPWVAEARVERRWPGTLAVALAEHVPLARWNDGALVSDAGRVFVAAYDGKLPRLAGPEGSAAEVVGAYGRFRKALAPLGLDIAALSLSPRRAWEVVLDNDTRLVLGRSEVETRLARFVALYPGLFVEAAPATVDLRYPDGFAARPAAGHSLIPPARPVSAPTVPSTP